MWCACSALKQKVVKKKFERDLDRSYDEKKEREKG